MKRIRIGDLLIQEGIITPEQLNYLLQKQKNDGFKRKLGELLIDEGIITETQLLNILARQLNTQFIDLYNIDIDFNLATSVPLDILKNKKLIPIKEDENYIYVATNDPLNYDAIELLSRILIKKPIKILLASTKDINYVLDKIETLTFTKTLVNQVKQELKLGTDIVEAENTAITKLVNLVISSAIKQMASDIHIEPTKNSFSIRIRVDGILRETFSFDIDIYSAFTSRIKLLANMDIAEKRRSQDGRFSLKFNNHLYDFRVSTIPTILGESIVMRILDQQKILLELDDLGMSEHNLKLFKEIIRAPYGMIFVTGPTGSGKTTTLYAALNELKSIENKVITIEDPVEYQLNLIQQIQINEKVGYDYKEALRNILRQDPDIIMIGEIRDNETLKASIQAALTGHLVLSTLHTNDAPSAITRMLQMGAENHLVANSLLAITAQRLVRKICPYCKTEYKPTKETLDKFKNILPDSENIKFYKGHGCKECNMTGYKGREMVSEILIINDNISKLISENKDKLEIIKEARKNGYIPMIEDGIQKVLNGHTTLEELIRVVRI